MKRRTFIKKTGAVSLITFISPSDVVQLINHDTNQISEEDFGHPPDEAYPQTYWFWMNGNITKEGITLDLEAMKRVGIGGVFNFDVGTGIPKGPIAYLSEEWIQLKKHAIKEAERLGLEFTMHNCPGWSASGGPWITPELAMQQLTWNEAYVSGGKQVRLALSKPAYRLNYYRDIAVLAFPSLQQEELMQSVKITSSSGEIDEENLQSKNAGIIVKPQEKDKSAWLQFEFDEPYEARLITFFISAIAAPASNQTSVSKPLEYGERTSVTLEASDDGIQFRLVTQINTGVETELLAGDKFIVYDIPVTRAKYFRLSSAKARRYRQVQFSGLTRLKNWMEKTNQRARTIVYVEEVSTIKNNNNQIVPGSSIVNSDAIIDLTHFMDKEGFLQWNAPVGNWTVLRIGFTPTGTLNRAAPDNGVGLECDKYSRSAFTIHFNKMMEHLFPITERLAAKGKMGLEIDSYEAGTQNWTPGFEQIFQKQRGYDLLQYLPALAGGRIVDSVEVTERFLWDLRRVQADLIAENYYGCFHELCHKHGFTAYVEPYDSGPMEEMQIGSRADSNLCEFWNGISSVFPAKTPVLRTPKLVASIAHINGQKIVGAEAFTAEPDSGRWQEYPFSLKAVGDKAFVKGVNRIVIHRYTHQPHASASPGMTMGPWGIFFERTNTWFNQSKPWLRYLARCQHMLQQGRFIADIVYFTGEDANMFTQVNPDELYPLPPEGYDYDLINAETIFKKVRIINNQIVLADGMKYRIFILQNYKAVTLELLYKLRDLVKDGMIMVGEKPVRSAGLTHYRDNDTEFNRVANELWGTVDSSAETQNH